MKTSFLVIALAFSIPIAQAVTITQATQITIDNKIDKHVQISIARERDTYRGKRAFSYEQDLVKGKTVFEIPENTLENFHFYISPNERFDRFTCADTIVDDKTYTLTKENGHYFLNNQKCNRVIHGGR